jgi:glycerophosphoryl diester phosphodiesterase
MTLRLGRAALLVLVAVFACVAPAVPHPEPDPLLVIGHRGAAGYLPDHTLEGYALAIRLGADYVEPDLVSTKDGRLIVRHEPNISATTDVSRHPAFASRKRTAIVDGEAQTGWFASDFTLREIKTLRALQPLRERPQQFNGRFEIPTFEEVIDLVRRESQRRHRTVGIYPETKHPTYHRRLGLPLEKKLAAALARAGLDGRGSPVFIQSFEPSSLKRLNRMTDVRLMQILDANGVNPDGSLDYSPPFDRPYDWTAAGDGRLRSRTFGYLASGPGLDEIATYADGVSAWKRYIVSSVAVDSDHDGRIGDENGDGLIDGADRRLLPPTPLIRRAHRRGLLVHTWTCRNEPRHLAADYAGDPLREYVQLFRLGADGVFSDFTDTAVEARRRFAHGE